MSSSHPLAVPSLPPLAQFAHRDSLLIIAFTVTLLFISSRLLSSARPTHFNHLSKPRITSQSRRRSSDSASTPPSSAVASESEDSSCNSPHAESGGRPNPGEVADDAQRRRSKGIPARLFDMLATTLYARPFPFTVPIPITVQVPVSLPVQGHTPPTDYTAPEPEPKLRLSETPWPVDQPYDAFLVLDVEATCMEGTNFDWPNEIIEFPVILMKWANKDKQGKAKHLVSVDEFRSYVKPTWKPELTPFCTSLTGITQADVERAPTWSRVLESFKLFLQKNGLIDKETGQRLVNFTWCTDGPFDIRDFVVKQCFISKVSMPEWLKGNVLDVRKVVTNNLAIQDSQAPHIEARQRGSRRSSAKVVYTPKRRSLNIPQQLRALGLAPFVGRQHSGIDDTRNIARIVIELAKRGIRLEPNTIIHPGRRWQWMGKPGQVLEEYTFV